MEEYADTRLADGLIWRLFHQLAIKRHVFGEAANEAVVQHAREVEIPDALNYIEHQLPDDGFAFGALSIADISIASFFRTASFVRYALDAARWPPSTALVTQVQALPVFQKLASFENCMLRLPLAEQRHPGHQRAATRPAARVVRQTISADATVPLP